MRRWLIVCAVPFGAIAGVLIGELYLLGVTVWLGDWSAWLGASILAVPVAALLGIIDSALAAAIIAVAGPPIFDRVWATRTVAGLAAAALPLLITFHAGVPELADQLVSGLVLAAAAALAAILTSLAILNGARCRTELDKRTLASMERGTPNPGAAGSASP
jgi:hypothetical protein